MEENRNEEIVGGCCLIVLLVFFLVCCVGKTVHDKAVENKMSVTDYSIVKIHQSIMLLMYGITAIPFVQIALLL